MLATFQNSSDLATYSRGSESKALMTNGSPPLCITSLRSCSVSEKFHNKLKQCMCKIICSLFKSLSWPINIKESSARDFPNNFLKQKNVIIIKSDKIRVHCMFLRDWTCIDYGQHIIQINREASAKTFRGVSILAILVLFVMVCSW